MSTSDSEDAPTFRRPKVILPVPTPSPKFQYTTPGIAAYKPLEVELLYNGVGLDVLGIGYETFPENLRTSVVAEYPRVNFNQDIAKAFLGGFEHKTQSTEGTCNEDICSHFIRNYRRSNFYEQIQHSPFQNS